MAPPPGIVEVRCAGCEETLEVEHGLTEFACPDCGTAQALPPELMPRRPRRALPLPGRVAPVAATPSRVSCGGCGAVLSVPHGHGHFSCPLCGTELAASPAAAVLVIAPPAAVPITLTRPAQPSEVLAGPSSQSVHSRQLRKPIRSEPKRSFREESFSSFGADTGTDIPVIRRLQNGPANPSSHREDLHTENVFTAGNESFHARSKMQEAQPNQDFHASEAQGMPSKSSIHKDKAEGLPSDTATMHSKQKTGYVVPSVMEHKHIKSLNHVDDVQQAGEIPNDMVHADQAQLDFATKATGNKKKSSKNSKANKKRKTKSVMKSSNELPHLRRSKRLVKGSPDLVEPEPNQKVDVSTNQSQSGAPCIERTLVDPDPRSPVHQFPHGGFNELDDVDTTTPTPLTHDAPQADQLRNIQMYSPETRWALPVRSSNSWHEHEMPPEIFSGIDQLNRDHEEVLSDQSESETQNQDLDWQLTQEACSDKNHSGHSQLKPQNENLSEGRQKKNSFTCSSLNDEEHPEDRTFSETRHKTSLSASCSHIAASLPFSAATTLSTTMLPSSREYLPLNCSNPSLLHQTSPSPQYLQEAPCGNDLPESISNPPKKRRGRAPEKLMEPRKEADRPVLTPSGTESWNVHPSCPKVANTLSLLIKQNYPGTYLSVDASKSSQPCEHVVYHWHLCPADTRSTILTEFLKRYKWSPGQEEECQKILDRKAVRQLFNLFCYEKQRARQQLAAKKAKKSLVDHKACGMELEGDREDSEAHQGDELIVVPEHEDPKKWKPFVPRWMKPKWWEMLCDHWATDEVMKISYQKRKNRNSGNKNWNSGKCPCKTVASRRIPIHQQQDMDNVENLGCDIDSPTKTPVGKGVAVDQNACETEEAEGALVGSHPLQEQVGSLKRERHCGAIGVCNKVQNESLSKSSPGCVSKQGHQPMFTKEQVKEMINQALQGLNEIWEHKFLSLEQKMPGVSSSYIVPNGCKVSSGVAKWKHCQLSREDTLDSADGESSPSARDDGDN
ncbi:hypothetical protein QOZ80_4AG0304520 [Eleusine coracana subsp. coracana]|nr:hypothetical protein QOZ80_4AG0304520 [Eleusine coracana subsp. coracana]